MILLGLWFIRGPRAKAPIDDEIPPFDAACLQARPGLAPPIRRRGRKTLHQTAPLRETPRRGEEAHRDEQP